MIERDAQKRYGVYEVVMQQRSDMHVLPADLPVPIDDGACDHLAGMVLPSIPLSTTDGEKVDLSLLRGRSVLYVTLALDGPTFLRRRRGMPFPEPAAARRNRAASAITMRSFDRSACRLSSG